MSQKRTGKVIKAYKSEYPDPLIITTGESLTVGKKESEWPGWSWCTNANGKTGWVPRNYLEINGDTGRAICDYYATELTVAVGEELVIYKVESGWAWCENKNGMVGWVPVECIEILK